MLDLTTGTRPAAVTVLRARDAYGNRWSLPGPRWRSRHGLHGRAGRARSTGCARPHWTPGSRHTAWCTGGSPRRPWRRRRRGQRAFPWPDPSRRCADAADRARVAPRRTPAPPGLSKPATVEAREDMSVLELLDAVNEDTRTPGTSP
ncbi:hypothetical protein QJS66_16875 [Kocuria rhizophila]|nr:hypothetical protein QJS66_16875 [Kocuria rhizophila]